MDSFDQTHLHNIKNRFQEKTGVAPARRKSLPIRRVALLCAAVMGCLSLTAMAYRTFSYLDGDALALYSTYHGDGIVTVHVENRSDKVLEFQPFLKLTQWNTSEELAPLGEVTFKDTVIQPHSSDVMTIDLSKAYDLGRLETPLVDDHYYLTLTNDGFLWGQSWMCSVDFAEHLPAQLPDPEMAETKKLEGIDSSLLSYFLADTASNSAKRLALDTEYLAAVDELIANSGVTVVSSLSPSMMVGGPAEPADSREIPLLRLADPDDGILLDETLPAKQQHEVIGLNYHGMDWQFKRLAGEGEHALVLKAGLPHQKYPDARIDLPVFYIFTYEKAAAVSDSYAFIRGQLHSFEDLEPYRIYENEEYVCYEVSPLFYDDILAYAEEFAAWDPSVRWDDAAKQFVVNFYDYYRENLSRLLYFE